MIETTRAVLLGMPPLACSLMASALGMEFRFVNADGRPVDWDGNQIIYREQVLPRPDCKAAVPEGVTTLLNLFVLERRGETVRALSPGVRIEGSVATFHVEAVTRSLRVSCNLCWAAGTLAVAEERSAESATGCVSLIGADGQVLRRLPTVAHPRAVAASEDTLFVVGEKEMAALRLSDGKELFRVSPRGGMDASQIAVIGERLYVGDRRLPAVRVFDAATGNEQSALLTSDELTMHPDLSGIGVAATAAGNLVVSDSVCVREFTIEDGKTTFGVPPSGGIREKPTEVGTPNCSARRPKAELVRKIADVKGGCSVAVDKEGNVAVAVPRSQYPGSEPLPEVWKFNAQGQAVLRVMFVYMRGPADYDGQLPDSLYKLRVAGGLIGAMRCPGGVAFDEQGRLYISDSLRWPKSETEFHNDTDRMEMDGGIVRYSADGDLEARLGSRYTNGQLIKARLDSRTGRPPLLRTAQAIQAGKLSLLAWGDSITQCGGTTWNGGASKTENNWVHVLARTMEAKHPGLTVSEVADGVGGQNAAQSLCRNPAAVAARGTNPDLILIQLGTNEQVFQLQTPAQFTASLRRMLTALIVTTDSDLVLVSTGPILDSKVPDPPEVYLRAMQAVGKEFGVPVVDINAAMQRRLADGTPFEKFHLGPRNSHPNDAGHQVWAEAVMEVLENGL